MRKAIFDRDILPAWNTRLLSEVTSDDLRSLCGKVKDRGAAATAIHVRDRGTEVLPYMPRRGGGYHAPVPIGRGSVTGQSWAEASSGGTSG